MPLALAALDARAPRRVTAAAIAAVLQGVFYWLILHEAVEPTARQASPSLEVTTFETAWGPRQALSRPKRPQPGPPRRLAPKKEAPSAPVARPIPLPRAGKPVAHPSVDWQLAMQGEVRAQDATPPPDRLRFGFPRRPAIFPAAPQFGWDYAHTHRVEALPEGGLLINLTDRCAVVLYVLLIPVCKIGHIATNGQLFDHMHDRRDEPDELP
jgi:hypothetical protein